MKTVLYIFTLLCVLLCAANEDASQARESEQHAGNNEKPSPLLKKLDDETFEHDTQASTGATTGDWFVLFYDAVSTAALQQTQVLEMVAQRLKGRVNVGVVDVRMNTKLAARFEVEGNALQLFFRNGYMYKFNILHANPDNVVDFIEAVKKGNVKGVEVPKAQNLIDTVKRLMLDGYADARIVVESAPRGSAVVALVGMFAGVCASVFMSLLCGMNKKEKKSKQSSSRRTKAE